MLKSPLPPALLGERSLLGEREYNVKMLENRRTNLLRLNIINTPIVNKVT